MPKSPTVPGASPEAPQEIDLSVLVPVCNEEESIAPLFERICDALKDFGKPWELIIVDDGSTDATLANVRKEFARPGLELRIVELQRNFGKAGALQAGIDAARGRLLVTLDGDLQNDPYDIPKMVAMLEERQLDLLCGWRKSRQDGLVLRLIPSWIANRLIRKITGVTIHDYGCGLKLYRTNILRQIRILGGMHRFIPAWIAGVVPTSRIGEMVVNHFPAPLRRIEIRHIEDVPGVPRPALGAVLHALPAASRAFLRLDRAGARRPERADVRLSVLGKVRARREHRHAADADRRASCCSLPRCR